MRKERWIVPVVVVLAVAWAVAQYLASLLFERELARALADLEARGDLRISRSDVRQGWLSSSGVLHIAPLIGRAWHLSLPYDARHGVLDTSVIGTVELHVGEADERLFGDAIPAAPPRWEAHYRTLGGTLQGELALAPFIVSQSPPRSGPRSLHFSGARIAFDGIYGDWRTRMTVDSVQLRDGEARLEVGPLQYQSRYAYTPGALHFNQQDSLTIEALSLRHPQVNLDGTSIVLQTDTQLDDSELRLKSNLTLGEIRSGNDMLVDGELSIELSRINADALRSVVELARHKTALGTVSLDDAAADSAMDRALAQLLKDSPRLDLVDVNLDSPMLGLSLHGDGVVVFDPRELDQLSPLALDDPSMRAKFRERLDGDFEWREPPAVVALWLRLPLDTSMLGIDVVKGQLRINGRPLPPLLGR
ncbi:MULTISPECIES: DUF945 family protein [Halomonas]|uniref:DUF945 family protein n=1 Tax=Halomonas TaxID=2745 RepID=UPI001C96AF01|nr:MULTISPECIES: DUF945 family protein [Halomonas]MBY5968430.1 YdgA family protein [Halomonas denitrificans]MBY6028224.1 YdgA family protein [Halomonas sp. DP8Y7-1]MEE3214479.1 DUF945 family protein [Pseudomonadota bacterium]